jgi:hypothetical protein
MQGLLRRTDRFRQQLLIGGRDDFVFVVRCRSFLLRGGCDVAHEARNALLGIGLAGYGELLIVVLPVLGIAQYAAGMIDETQGLFDVALAVARFRIIFSDEAAQRGPHLFVRCELRYSQCLVERCLHRQSRENACNLTLECSGKPLEIASYR